METKKKDRKSTKALDGDHHDEELKQYLESLKHREGKEKLFTKEDLESFRPAIEYGEHVPVPYPLLNEDANRSYVKDRFLRKPPKDGVIPEDKHLVITEFSLDHWLAQTFKLDINEIPPVRPASIPKSVYEQLRKYVKYGSINYEQQMKKNKRLGLKREAQQAESSDLKSPTTARNNQNEMQGKPTKYTYIVYPKSMKVLPFVDQLEQQQATSETRQPRDQFDSFDDSRVRLGEGDDSVSPLSRSKSRGVRSRSRNQNISRTQGTPALSKVKIQKLPNFKAYIRPNRNIRNRIRSDMIKFMNPTEIEHAATNYEKYLINLKEINSSLQSIPPLNIDLPENQPEPKRLIMDRRQSRDTTATKQENNEAKNRRNLLQSFQEKRPSLQKSLRNRSGQFVATNNSSFFHRASNQAASTGISPYINLPGSTLSYKGILSEKSHYQMTTPPTAASPREASIMSPRNSIGQQKSALIMRMHIDKSKTITMKSKLRQFRDQMDQNKQNERSNKLANIVKRNIHQSQNSFQGSSMPILIQNDEVNAILQSGAIVLDHFGTARQSAVTIPNKLLFQNIMKPLDTTTLSDFIMEDTRSLGTHEERGSLSQRTNQKQIVCITKHLEEEIDESRKGQRDNISIHMIEITLDFNELQKRINDMNNPDFWLQKAIQKQKNNPSDVATEGAIDYYKQGLRIAPQSEKLLYNIACSFERIGKFENAIRWFKHVLEVSPTNSDSYFGLALANFKVKRYLEAVKNIEKGLENHGEKSLSPYEHLLYFRAMCFKRTGQFAECSRDYSTLRDKFNRNMNRLMVKYVFGILLLPLQEERKVGYLSRMLKTIQLISNFVENFNDLMILYSLKQYPTTFDTNRLYLSQFCFTKKIQPPWKFDWQRYKHYILYYLSKKSFFNRIPKLVEFQNEIETAVVRKYEKNEIILIPNDKTCGVILVGTMLAISHSEDIMRPRLLFKCSEGTILGFSDIDNGATSNSETWMIAYETTEVIYLKKEDLIRMWDLQRMQTEKQIILSSLQRNMFFHFLTQQLKYYLIYEKMIEKVYLPGEIVVLQSKRSIMNNNYKVYYENRPTKFQQEIENRKQMREVETGKKQSEIGTLMDVMRSDTLKRLKADQGGDPSQRKKRIQSRERLESDRYGFHSTGQSLKESQKNAMIIEQDAFDSVQQDLTKGDVKGKFVLAHLTEPVKNTRSLIPEDDQDEKGYPYVKGVYIVQSGHVNIIYNHEVNFTLKNGDSFGESLILKQPSYEYFGDLVAGPGGARCYLFTYDVLRSVPFQTVIDIIEIAGFQRKKEGLVHMITQKYNFETSDLLKY